MARVWGRVLYSTQIIEQSRHKVGIVQPLILLPVYQAEAVKSPQVSKATMSESYGVHTRSGVLPEVPLGRRLNPVNMVLMV